jgi:hypothetical protein
MAYHPSGVSCDTHVNGKGGLECDFTPRLISTIAASTCTRARMYVCIMDQSGKVLVH